MIKISQAKKQDMKQAVELVRRLPEIYNQRDPFYRLEKNYSRKHVPYLKKLFQKGVYFLAKDNDQIAGVLIATVQKRIPIFDVKKGGIIKDIFIHPDYRRQGLATKLLREAQRYFKKKKIKFIELQVKSDNCPALKAYEKFGFEEYKKMMRKKI